MSVKTQAFERPSWHDVAEHLIEITGAKIDDSSRELLFSLNPDDATCNVWYVLLSSLRDRFWDWPTVVQQAKEEGRITSATKGELYKKGKQDGINQVYAKAVEEGREQVRKEFKDLFHLHPPAVEPNDY